MFSLIIEEQFVNLHTVILYFVVKMCYYFDIDVINRNIIESLFHLWLLLLFVESIIIIYIKYIKKREI